MNKHTSNYLLTHDIDIIFQYRGIGIHYASNGNLIPRSINYIKSLNAARIEAANLRYIVNRENLFVNRQYIEKLYSEQERIIEQTCRENEVEPLHYDVETFETFYLSSFARMAMRGFYSFDCMRSVTKINEEEGNTVELTLVAGPNRGFNFRLFRHSPFVRPEFPFADLSELVHIIDETHLTLKI